MRSLSVVDFFDGHDRPIDGLAQVGDPNSAESPHERATLSQAKDFELVSHVLFRRFKDSDGRHLRSSQVVAYVVDNSKELSTENEIAELHHKLWLHGVAPIVYVAWSTKVDILTCTAAPDFWDAESGTRRYNSAARIEVQESNTRTLFSPADALTSAGMISAELSRLRRRFSAFRLIEGTFWDEPENQSLSKQEASAHQLLIQAIVEADTKLHGRENPVRRRLLVLMVLIKYLEDRGVFPAGYFGRYHSGARSFRDILSGGSVHEVLKLLRYFENKFNGDVFSLGADADNLTDSELKQFASLVGGKELGGQLHFWELFSFKYIPVEVISRLYQRFVTGHGAVYTPPFLAALILDQVMPYDRIKGTELVLDPACGSGIFLVAAFKRLVNHWRSRHKWRKPKVEDLKKILTASIFGVELEAGAIDLTSFSLALAVCDALEPPVIWSSLKFDKLTNANLKIGDFFDPETTKTCSTKLWPDKFDIVMGNPPFESSLTPAAIKANSDRSKRLPSLPDKQVAYLFLEKGIELLSDGGSICLIQPNGILYNGKTHSFRRYLMGKSTLKTILDFISLRGLYEGADPKTIAWHATNTLPSDGPVNHITFRRTYSVSQRIAFEMDHYDQNSLPQSLARESAFVWRVGLLGGGRLYGISERYRKMRKLSDFVQQMGWEYGEGFIAGEKGKRQVASFLTGMEFVPSEALGQNGIDRSALDRVTEKLFRSSYNEARFTTPLLLIKKHQNLHFAIERKGKLAYKAQIVGIHPSNSDNKRFEDFVDLFEKFHSEIRFALSLNGTRGLTAKATAIEKQDIDILPIPENSAEFKLSFWEEALKRDVLDYMMDYVRLGQDSHILKTVADSSTLLEYSTLYLKMLGSLYHSLKADTPIFLNGLIAQPFFFGEKPNISWWKDVNEVSIHNLVYSQDNLGLRTIRVMRYYDENIILVVKPDRLRYWIPSTAIRDADDTLVDLRMQGWR